ncbi:Protein NETWORKED 3A [Linum grandiflorum]
MLKVIEQDADSFAQRAEMYYKKRPELINMVEDFYRTHRSLVEEYDQLNKSTTTSHSDIYDHHHHEDSAAESEVDDPELEEEEILADAGELLDEEQQNSFEKATEEMKREYEARIASQKEEMKTLKEEAEELKEENRIQKEELWQKDEEKREVIRQLSLGMEMLRSENMELRKKQQQQQSSSPVQRRSPFEFGKLKDTIFTKLFHGSPTPKVIIAAPSQI